jgi:hypothetical protein
MHCTAFGHSTGTIHLLYKNDPQCCFNYQSVETQFANPVKKNIFIYIYLFINFLFSQLIQK